MCVDPVTGIMVGTAVIGTGLSIADRFSQQSSAVANRSSALNSVWEQTAPNVNRALADVYNTNTARAVQERDKSAVESFDILRAMAEHKASATVAASEAGVGGVSFSNVLQDLEMRAGMAKGNLDYNYLTTIQSIDDDNRVAHRKAQAQIASAVNAAVQGTPIPSDSSVWMGAAGDAVKGGLSIAKVTGAFDDLGKKSGPKVDKNTGRSIDAEIAEWSNYGRS